MLLFAGAVSATEEPSVTVTTSVDRPEVAIGDPIRYTIRVQHPTSTAITMPSLDATLGEFQVVQHDAPSTHRAGAVSVTTQDILLTILTTGGTDGLSAPVHGQAVTVTVKSLLPTDWQTQDIRDIKPPVVVLRMRWWMWAVLLCALLGGLAGWWWHSRLKPSTPPLPPRPPHEVALEALERLSREQLAQQQRYTEYYVKLSGIVRVYIEARFDLKAPEMTTEEFLKAAAHAATVVGEHRQSLEQFLLHCDLVKFARYHPSLQEAEETFAAAVRLIHHTTPSSDLLGIAATSPAQPERTTGVARLNPAAPQQHAGAAVTHPR